MKFSWILGVALFALCNGHHYDGHYHYHHNTVNPHYGYGHKFVPEYSHPKYPYNMHSHDGIGPHYHAKQLSYHSHQPDYPSYHKKSIYDRGYKEGPYDKYSFWKTWKYSKMIDGYNPMCKYSVYKMEYWKWKKHCRDYYRNKYESMRYREESSPYDSYRRSYYREKYWRNKHAPYYAQNTMYKSGSPDVHHLKENNYGMYTRNGYSREHPFSEYGSKYRKYRYSPEFDSQWKLPNPEYPFKYKYYKKTPEYDSHYKYKKYSSKYDSKYKYYKRGPGVDYTERRKENERPIVIEVYDQNDGKQYTHEIKKPESSGFGHRIGDIFREIAKGMQPIKTQQYPQKPNKSKFKYYQKRKEVPSFPGSSYSKYDFSRTPQYNTNHIGFRGEKYQKTIPKYQTKSKACFQVLGYVKQNKAVPKSLDVMCAREARTIKY